MSFPLVAIPNAMTIPTDEAIPAAAPKHPTESSRGSRPLDARTGVDSELLFFLGLIAIHLIPIWLHGWFPSQDGPSHLDNANILRHYGDPAYAALSKYYLINEAISPNWFTAAMLMGLMSVFQPLLAEKILLSVYVILFPSAVRFALGSIRVESKALASLALPFVYNFCLHYGFYNYCFGLAGFFLVFGCWIRFDRAFNVRTGLILAFFSVLLYFCHLVPLVMVYIAIALMTVWLSFKDQQTSDGSRTKRGWSRLLARTLGLMVSALPAIALTALYLGRLGVSTPAGARPVRPIRQFDFLFLMSFEPSEAWICGAVFALQLALVVHVLRAKHRTGGSDPWDGLIAVMMLYALVYRMSPDAISGGAYLKSRLTFFPFFALLLWVGAHSFSRSIRWRVHLAVAAISVVQLGFYATRYQAMSQSFDEVFSATDKVERNATMLPLCFSPRGLDKEGKSFSIRVEPFLHFAGTIAAERGAVNLLNYEANHRVFQVLFRTDLNPYRTITPIESGFENAPPIDFVDYSSRTNGNVDYVLVFGLQPTQARTPAVQHITKQLESGYVRIHVSTPTGLLQLYRRKDFDSSGTTTSAPEPRATPAVATGSP